MKAALIQETEESSDGAGQKIFDVELTKHQDSESLVVTHLKVKLVFLRVYYSFKVPKARERL